RRVARSAPRLVGHAAARRLGRGDSAGAPAVCRASRRERPRRDHAVRRRERLRLRPGAGAADHQARTRRRPQGPRGGAWTAAADRLGALPGAAAVGATSQVPFGDIHEGRSVARPGRDYTLQRTPTYSSITADYFKAIGLPVLRGRDFTRAEEATPPSPRFAIVD